MINEAEMILLGKLEEQIRSQLKEEYSSALKNKIPVFLKPYIKVIEREKVSLITGNKKDYGLEGEIKFLDSGTDKKVFLVEHNGSYVVKIPQETYKAYINEEQHNPFFANTIVLQRARKIVEREKEFEKSLEHLIYVEEETLIVNYLEGKTIQQHIREKTSRFEYSEESLERISYVLAEMYSENIFPLDAHNSNVIVSKDNIALLDFHLLDLEFFNKNFYDERKMLMPQIVDAIKHFIRTLSKINSNDPLNYFEETAFLSSRILPYLKEAFKSKNYILDLRESDILPD